MKKSNAEYGRKHLHPSGRTRRGDLRTDTFSHSLRGVLQLSLSTSHLFSFSQVFRLYVGAVIKSKIKELERQIDELIPSSQIARIIKTIPGFSTITAGTLAGEIDALDRFESENSLALYMGMTNLENSSGKHKGSKRNTATNKNAKTAMITAVMKHAQHVEESKRYIDKKISEGKNYQQAIRSLGRHMVRVIWNMIQKDRDYEIREV